MNGVGFNGNNTPLSQQDVDPTSFGPVTAHPSPPPNASTGQPPPTPSATVAGGAVLPMDPSALAALQQATHHLVLLPRAHMLAPLTDPTWCEEQTPLQERSVAQAPSSQKYQSTPSELPFGQQDAHPTFFGPLTIDPSLPPDPLSHHPPAADPRLEVTPTEEVCRDHSSAELVIGWGW